VIARLRSFAAFWYDFVVGDDWRLALAALLAIGLTALVAAAHGVAWPVAPIVVVIVLAVSVTRAARRTD